MTSTFEKASLYIPHKCSLANVVVVKVRPSLINIDLYDTFSMAETAMVRIMTYNVPAIVSKLRRSILLLC